MIKLAFASLRARWLPVLLVLISLTASMVMLLSVDRIQTAAKSGFNQSINGVDLLVGPRSGDIELLLYTVFHIGKPTNNITMQSVEELSKRQEIDWVVPIALGDTHRGYRVVATTQEYFDKVKYSVDKSLSFREGSEFSELNQVVLGHQVAQELGYQLGSKLFVTHGSGRQLGREHDDFRFEVSGILEPTGTPIDKGLFVSLEGYELIHLGWQSGRKVFGLDKVDVSNIPLDKLKPDTVTAAFVGLKSKVTLFRVARSIAEYPKEALSALVPSIALSELWSIVGMVDQVFKLLSWIVIGIAIIGMVTLTLSTLDARNREMAILRACGASPLFISGLVLIESLLVGLTAIVLSVGFVMLITYLAQDILLSDLGVLAEISLLSSQEAATLLSILGAGLLSSLLPAVMVYKRSLSNGLTRL